MIGIIVSGHGSFASGISSSVDLILGKQSNYEVIDFPYDSSILNLEKLFDNAIIKLNDCDKIIILVDLFGGSPFNIAMKKVITSDNLILYYGINLGMLIELLSRIKFKKTLEEVQDEIVEIGRKQINIFDKNEMGYIENTNEMNVL